MPIVNTNCSNLKYKQVNDERSCRFCYEWISDEDWLKHAFVKLDCTCVGLPPNAHQHCTKQHFKSANTVMCHFCEEECRGIPTGGNRVLVELPSGKRMRVDEYLAKKNKYFGARAKVPNVGKWIAKLRSKGKAQGQGQEPRYTPQIVVQSEDWWFEDSEQ